MRDIAIVYICIYMHKMGFFRTNEQEYRKKYIYIKMEILQHNLLLTILNNKSISFFYVV